MDTDQAPMNTTPIQPSPLQAPPPPRNHKKPLLIGITVIVLALLAGIGWSLSQNNKSTPNDEIPTIQDTTPSEVTTEAVVSISETGFEPATLQVKPGSTVTWINQSNTPRGLVSATNEATGELTLEGFDSEAPLAPGESFSFTFEASGVFSYSDPSNPGFAGEVIVE